MTIAWMLYAVGVGLLIAIAAASAEWALKSAKRPVRFVWVGAIAMTTIFTLLAPLRAPKPQPMIALSAITVTETSADIAFTPTLFERVSSNVSTALDLLVRPARMSMDFAKAAPRIANMSAAAFWVLSAAIALVVLLTVYTRSMRESRHWPRMTLLGRSVRVAPDVGPAVMGMAPPEIVIPRWVLKRNLEEQQLVLAHESEHVRAHDPLLLVFACIAVALMPWNAAVWFMWSRLRLAVELDCDRRVLLRGVQKPAYGELLVELSSRRPWNSLATPAFSWGTSHLEKRLVAMTSRPVRFSVARRIASAGVVAIALVAACNSEMPTAAQVQAMDVSALAARVPLTDSTLYFIDSRPVSKADAQAIVPEDISSVEIQRADKASPVAKVHVTLVDDSTRKRRIASRPDTLHTFVVRDDSRQSGAATTGVTVQGDSITLRVRPDRNLSQIAPEKAAAPMGATGPATNEQRVTISDDSHVAEVSGKKVSVIFRDQACLPQGSIKLNSVVTANGQEFRGQGQLNVHTAAGEQILAQGQFSSSASTPVTRACPTGTPLVVVDGVIMPASFQLDQIRTMDIESIEVIKGQAAQRLYGSKAENGVISIKLKK